MQKEVEDTNKLIPKTFGRKSDSARNHVRIGWIRFAKSYWGFTATILSHYPIIE